MTALNLALALDALHEDLTFWVHYNDPEAKRRLLRRYEALPERQRAALERAVEAVFPGPTLVAYRRMKPGDRLDQMGGMSLSTDRPTHATFETFELRPEDVLLHWAVTYPNGETTALGSRAFGHEHEVILRAGARPRRIGSGRAELRDEASPLDALIKSTNALYPQAEAHVDGLFVRDHVPNLDSINGYFADSETLSGIRVVPMSDFGGPRSVFYAVDDFERSERLAELIERSGEINPLIIGVDEKGPFIIEGAHRFVALWNLKVRAFPAVVVVGRD